jgi:hypothetical protein
MGIKEISIKILYDKNLWPEKGFQGKKGVELDNYIINGFKSALETNSKKRFLSFSRSIFTLHNRSMEMLNNGSLDLKRTKQVLEVSDSAYTFFRKNLVKNELSKNRDKS